MRFNYIFINIDFGMNWVGGARNRVKLKDERKRQQDFFAKQKLKKQIERSHSQQKGTKPSSLDLLSLQAANYTASQYSSEGSSVQRGKRKSNVIKLEKSQNIFQSFRHYESLGSPLSPPGAPSMLQLAESDTRNTLRHQHFGSKQEESKNQSIFARRSGQVQFKTQSQQGYPYNEGRRPLSTVFRRNRKNLAVGVEENECHDTHKLLMSSQPPLKKLCLEEISIRCQQYTLAQPVIRNSYLSSSQPLNSGQQLQHHPKLKVIESDKYAAPLPHIVEESLDNSPKLQNPYLNQANMTSASYGSNDQYGSTREQYEESQSWAPSSDIFFQFPGRPQASPSSTEMSYDSPPRQEISHGESMWNKPGGSTMSNFKLYLKESDGAMSSSSLSSRELMCSEDTDFTSPDVGEDSRIHKESKENLCHHHQDSLTKPSSSPDYSPSPGKQTRNSPQRTMQSSEKSMAEKVLKEVFDLDRKMNNSHEQPAIVSVDHDEDTYQRKDYNSLQHILIKNNEDTSKLCLPQADQFKQNCTLKCSNFPEVKNCNLPSHSKPSDLLSHSGPNDYMVSTKTVTTKTSMEVEGGTKSESWKDKVSLMDECDDGCDKYATCDIVMKTKEQHTQTIGTQFCDKNVQTVSCVKIHQGTQTEESWSQLSIGLQTEHNNQESQVINIDYNIQADLKMETQLEGIPDSSINPFVKIHDSISECDTMEDSFQTVESFSNEP